MTRTAERKELADRLDEAIKASRELAMPQVALSMTDAFAVRDLLRRQPSVEEVASTFYTARVRAAGFDLHGASEVPWADLPDDMKADYREAARQIAALHQGKGEG